MTRIRNLLRVAYAPLLLIGVNGLAFLWISSGRAGWGIAALLVLAISLSCLAERLLPYQATWNHSQGEGRRDLLHAIVNETSNFSGLLFLPIVAELAPGRGLWPTGWPFVVQVVFSILLLDLGITLTHYASHRVPTLWRFHAVHHSVRRMYGFNGLMKHPIHQSIETLGGTLPLILLGLPSQVATALVFAVVVQLLLQHSNVDYTVGPFRRLLATSEVHRFHHQKSPELGDVNFGLFTTLWDHALGTFFVETRERFESNELGIAAEPDYPTAYVPQLLEPFRRRRDASPAAGAH